MTKEITTDLSTFEGDSGREIERLSLKGCVS